MFEKLRGRIRDFLPSSDPKEPAPFQPKAHPIEQLEKPNAIEFPKITNRYRWINYGFNRKERRRFEARGRKGLLTKIEKMMLKANPRNFPSNGGVNNPYYGVNV